MKTPRSLILLWLLLAVAFATAAQEPQPPSEPGGLVIQITNPNQAAPSFLPVPGANAKLSSVWTPSFKRVAGFRPEPGTPPVRAVNFASRVAGDAARVFVSIYFGVRYFDKEVEAGSYLLHEGDTAVVKELRVFSSEGPG